LIPERAARRAGLVAGLLTLAGAALTLNRMLVGVFYDDGLYVGIAYALSHGLGYVHPHLPGHPAAVHYPPLYPLVLAPFFGLLSVPTAALAAKMLNAVFAALGAGLIAWHASRSELLGPGAPSWLAVAMVVAAALALPTLSILTVLFSEPLFALLVAIAVIVADRPPQRWPPAWGALAAGGAAALALLTRSIGVAAGVGVVLFLVLVRRAPWCHAALVAAPVVAAALAWGWWVLRHRGGIDPAMATNYGSYFEVVHQAGLGLFWASLSDLPRPLGALTLSWLPSALYYVFGATALTVLLYGLVLLARRSSIGFTLLGYFAILAVWPFPSDRFIWVVLPWLGLAWAAAARDLARRQTLRLAVALVAAAIVVGYGQLEVRGLGGRLWSVASGTTSATAARMLPGLATLPPNAVIAADAEALVWLYTGRTTVPFYVYSYRGRHIVYPPPAEQRAYLERQGVTHIMIGGYGGTSAAELDALLGAYPGWITMAQGWPGGGAVFRVKP